MDGDVRWRLQTARSGAVAQLLPQEGVEQRVHVRRLAVVGRAAVAALDVLVVAHGRAGLAHPRVHLAGVARVYAVIAGGGEQDGGRVLLRRVEQVVGREGLDVFPLLRDVRVAVF